MRDDLCSQIRHSQKAPALPCTRQQLRNGVVALRGHSRVLVVNVRASPVEFCCDHHEHAHAARAAGLMMSGSWWRWALIPLWLRRCHRTWKQAPGSHPAKARASPRQNAPVLPPCCCGPTCPTEPENVPPLQQRWPRRRRPSVAAAAMTQEVAGERHCPHRLDWPSSPVETLGGLRLGDFWSAGLRGRGCRSPQHPLKGSPTTQSLLLQADPR